MSLLLATIVLLGCGNQADLPVASPSPEAKPVTDPPAPAAPSVWSPANIGELKPQPPQGQALTQHPLTANRGIERAMEKLNEVVQAHAKNPDDPWALGHGILVHGSDMRLPNGSSAVDHLFATYARTFQAGSRELIYFPEKSGDTLVQPHAELLLKAITEADVSPDRSVTVQGKPFTVADLYRGSLLKTFLVPQANHSSFASTNDMPWALQALAAWAPAELKWKALDGTEMSLDALTDFNAVVLKKETRFLAQAMKQRTAFKKQRQGIYQYTCGGAHLAQGVSFAVARGFGHMRGHTLVEEQGPLALFRMQVELDQLDAAAKDQPTVAFQINIQRLKLTGHTLETLHKMSAAGQLAQDTQTTNALNWVAGEVVKSIALLDGHKAFEQLDKVKAKDLQLYRDIVGDSCHALRGLKLATGSSTIRLRPRSR